MSEPHLLVTKFIIPPIRAELLPRVALIERLNQNCMLPLVLLSAGAGFGKTTLLSVWANQSPSPVAWLSLDHLDNDPQRFWRTMIAALRMRLPTVGEAALAQLQAPQPPQLVPLLTSLINELVALGEETILIVDDYHVIEVQVIHESLAFLLDHVPLCLHLVIASRVDPPMPLSRWRVRGQMAEIRDAELRLTERETASFLREVMGVPLGKEEVRGLAARTEGWIAGVQLAALSLRGHTDPSAFVNAFSGSQRFILDYVQEEILAHQPLAIQRFLMQTSILDRMHAALCQAVTGEQESAALLERIERANLFLTPLDEQRQWYHFHPLFREALLAHLRANEPELVPTLYERAARWYEQQGLFADALEASLKAGAFAHAAMLIERCIDSANFHNEYHLLCQWMERLPEEMIQAQPELSFQYAQAIMFSTPRRSPASWIRIEPLLQWAEQGFEVQAKSERLGTALELHSGLALFQGDLASMLLFAQRSHPLLARNSEIYSSHLMFRGYGHLLAGNLAAAWQGFLEGYRIAESHSLRTKAFAASLLLGEACFAKGDLLAASRYFHKDLADADENPEIFRQRFIASKETFFAFWVYHNLAMLSYECNELATAQHYLAQAQALGDDPEEEIHVLTSGRIIWARLLHRCGETVRAEHLLRTWERQARWPWVLRAIRACQARLHLEMGNLSAVEHWSRTKDDFFGFPLRERDRNLPYVFQEKEALLMVQLLLAQEKAEEALRALAPWKEKAQAQGRMHALLGILILEALARFAARSLPQARSTLQQALRLAQPENFQRLFLDEGQPMQAMLKSTLKEIQEPELAAYGRRLLQAFEREQMPGAPSSASASSALLDPLTPQENRILQLYPIVGYRYRSEAILSEEVATPAQDGIELLKPLELNRLPGTRIPHLWIERAEQRLCTLDLLDGRFVLLIGPGGITWGEAAPGGAAAWQPTALDWMEICWIWSKAGQQRWASQLRVWCWCGLMVLCGLAQRHLTDQFSEDVYDILPHLQAGMLELRHLF